MTKKKKKKEREEKSLIFSWGCGSSGREPA
jgi:hypothetical protein